jgi:hypothetical protein
MPKQKDETAQLLDDLAQRLGRIVTSAIERGREQALTELRAVLAAGRAVPPRGPGRPRAEKSAPKKRAKSSKPRKNPWADMTPEQRLARINSIRVGRGLPPKESL